jgi:hypothetical protein
MNVFVGLLITGVNGGFPLERCVATTREIAQKHMEHAVFVWHDYPPGETRYWQGEFKTVTMRWIEYPEGGSAYGDYPESWTVEDLDTNKDPDVIPLAVVYCLELDAPFLDFRSAIDKRNAPLPTNPRKLPDRVTARFIPDDQS